MWNAYAFPVFHPEMPPPTRSGFALIAERGVCQKLSACCAFGRARGLLRVDPTSSWRSWDPLLNECWLVAWPHSPAQSEDQLDLSLHVGAALIGLLLILSFLRSVSQVAVVNRQRGDWL